MASITETLRAAMNRCGVSRYAISKVTGIPQSVLSRFADGQPLRGGNIDKLGAYLNLELKPKTGKAGKD